MIDLNDIRGYSAMSLLENYSGINPYIKRMRNEYLKNKKLRLTDTQINYVIDNHEREPILINRVIGISRFLGEELQRQEGLKIIPEKILVEYILAENDKTFHIYGKLKRNQIDSKMYWLPKTQVLDDPYFEPINVDVDFDKYNKILSKYGKKLYTHQEEGIRFLLSRNGSILADDMGLGKAEAIDNQLFTPNGRQKIGTLKINDFVIGVNGLPTRINGIYPQGIQDLYRITFNDGYSVVVCGEHLFTVSSNNSGKNSKNRVNRNITLSVKQMLDKNLILEQNGIGWNNKKPYKFKTYYKQNNGQNKWQIPIVKPIEFTNYDVLPIDPYLLGLGLGDGYFKDNKIMFGIYKDDFDELFSPYQIKENKSNKPNIRLGYINIGISLSELKLKNARSDTKFIPDIYKYSSIENRLAILQGLMDTDGHCMKSKNGCFNGTEYCSVSEKLADDVAEIVHSLGGIVRKSSKIGSYKKKDGTKVICKKVYKLNIKMPEQFNPFRLKRKANQYNVPKKYSVGRYIKNIESVGKGEAVCIAVDAPDKLYVTEHAIVTHNTTQAIIAALESGAKNVLIICPSAVKINWKREISLFCDDITIVNGRIWPKTKHKFTIINYDILKNFHTLGDGKKKKDTDPVLDLNRQIVNTMFDLVIVDEAHNLKNNKSIRGEIVADLSTKFNIEKFWLLTGTPVANRPMDFFNLLKIIKSPIAENWMYFAKRYCDGKKFFKTLKNGKKKQIWLTDGASNLDELSSKTRNLIIRRLKTDVLDMPDKIVTPVYHELTSKQLSEYEKLWEDYLEKRKQEKKKGPIQKDLVELILLRKFIAMEAIPETIEMVNNALEMDKKVIIFTTFTDELNELADYFGKICVTHNGPMSQKEKQNSVDEFQNNPKIKVFIGNIKSAGVGITLTQGNVVIFNSFDWVPGNNEQAEDRPYRIGQTKDVNVYYQLYEDTISIRMWETLKYKTDVISIIIGDKQLSEEEIIELMTDKLMDENG